jgi:hypothetical protein
MNLGRARDSEPFRKSEVGKKAAESIMADLGYWATLQQGYKEHMHHDVCKP